MSGFQHEAQTLNARPILISAGVVAGVIILASVVVYHGFAVLGPPVVKSKLAAPATDAAAQQKRKQSLQAYGWVDRQNAIAHIPIERAIDLVAKQLAEEVEGTEQQQQQQQKRAR